MDFWETLSSSLSIAEKTESFLNGNLSNLFVTACKVCSCVLCILIVSCTCLTAPTKTYSPTETVVTECVLPSGQEIIWHTVVQDGTKRQKPGAWNIHSAPDTRIGHLMQAWFYLQNRGGMLSAWCGCTNGWYSSLNQSSVTHWVTGNSEHEVLL